MITAMYLRKSRAEENESVEFTLSRHKDTLLRFAVANELVIAETFEEVVSGDSLFARPAMLRLLEEIERFEAILCMDIDRLGRGNMKEQGIILETIKEANVKIITPRKVYDLNNELDETYSEFQAFMARQELKLIKNRMQRGIRKSAEEGGHMGPAPYGYRKIRVGKSATLEIIPEEAEIVRMIFTRYAAGAGSFIIASHLNEMGVVPQRIKRWTQISVRRILRNEVYAGRIVYGRCNPAKRIQHPEDKWIVARGLHEPIIDEELFEKVQMLSKERYLPPRQDFTTIRNPLAGLIKCSQCGYALDMGSVKTHKFYKCRKKNCVCSSSLQAVEDALLDELRRHLDTIETGQKTEPTGSETISLIPSLEAELLKAGHQKDRLHDLLEQGVYTITVFNERMGTLLLRIRQLEEAISVEQSKNTALKADVLVPAIKDILAAYSDCTPHEKNLMLKSILKRVMYHRPKGSKPDNLTLLLEFK